MKIILTVELLQAVYEMLRELAPFRSWGLPLASEIEFLITKNQHQFGHYTKWYPKGHHEMGFSQALLGSSHLITLVMVVAHEMIHLKQKIARTETPGALHNAEYGKLARMICRRYGWDPNRFFY